MREPCIKWLYLLAGSIKKSLFFFFFLSHADVAVSGWLSSGVRSVWVRRASARIHRLRFEAGVATPCSRAQVFGGRGRWSHGRENGS